MSPEHMLTQLARAVAAGEIPEDDVAEGYDILEATVVGDAGPGEFFEVEDPEYPYVKSYQVVRRIPGVSRAIFRSQKSGGWVAYLPARFLCKLVDMRRVG